MKSNRHNSHPVVQKRGGTECADDLYFEMNFKYAEIENLLAQQERVILRAAVAASP